MRPNDLNIKDNLTRASAKMQHLLVRFKEERIAFTRDILKQAQRLSSALDTYLLKILECIKNELSDSVIVTGKNLVTIKVAVIPLFETELNSICIHKLLAEANKPLDR